MPTDAKRPLNALWPNPGEIDTAINKRAQAMARTDKEFSRADSDAAADRLIDELFGRNAEIEPSERSKIREILWNDYGSYPQGYRGYHLTGPGKKHAHWKNTHGFDATDRRLRLHRALDCVMDRVGYGRATATDAAVNSVRGRGWIQEWYETGSAEMRQRAAKLRQKGYRVSVQNMGSQVTQWGSLKLSLLDIRPGDSGDPDLDGVEPAEKL